MAHRGKRIPGRGWFSRVPGRLRNDSLRSPPLRRPGTVNLQKQCYTPVSGMTLAFWREVGEDLQAVTYQKHLAQKRFVDTIDTSLHAIEYSALASSVIMPIGASMPPAKIFWSAPHPPSTPAHWRTIVDNATRRSITGQATEIYTHRSLGTITRGRVSSGMKPDWAEITHSGRIRIFEVVSPSQTETELLKKGWKYRQLLGDNLEYYDVIQIGQQIP